MLNVVLLLLFGFLVFSLSLIGYKNYRSTTLYALAIGGVVNANFFHAGAYPIECFGMSFGIDSIIYTLFAFCVMMMLIKENKKSAYILAISSLVAILFSASMQLFADLFSKGSSKATWITFAAFCISIFASAVAVIAAVEFLSRIKNHINQYLLMICGISIITIIDGIIYYPLISAVCAPSGGMGELILTSFIGKAISLGYGLLMLYFINRIEKRIIRKNI